VVCQREILKIAALGDKLMCSAQIFIVNMGKTCFSDQIHCLLIDMYGDGVLTVQHVRKWCKEVESG
jgi:hypothetical protein